MLVDKNGLSIEADTYPALFYGLQTAIQLLPAPKAVQLPAGDTKIKQKPGKTKVKVKDVPGNYKPQAPANRLPLSYISISDYPRFSYRGVHLDVCRHFFPVSFIKTYIDILAAHKMNTFHWHLTDDQGWRIEIKKFPELTAVGGWRHGTITGRYPGNGNDNTRYGGFYTQDEVRDVVRYAQERFITVVPE
ncbi:MAG: hypothetical protein EOP50_04095, partial [Sphingobacteriales bacterium]